MRERLVRQPWPLVATLLLLALPASGCALQQNRLLKTEIQDLQSRIYELQKRNAEAQVEIEELRERGAGAPGAPAVTGGPTGIAGQEESPEVPGSTVDLGDEGPARAIESSRSDGNPGSHAGGGSPGGPVTGGNSAAPTEGDRLYVDGYARFNSGNFVEAQQRFQEFLARSPQSDLADDAQYWIGECYFSQKDYRRAILEFRKVIDQFPFGNRVPHAFLKVGLSYLALGERDRAAENLETVVEAFPKSDVATVARATLDELQKSPSR